jgi:hypothetical protein
MKDKLFFFGLLAGVVLLSFASVGAESKPDAAVLRFPADKKINISSGTLEVNFSLNYSFDDYLRPELSEFCPFNFLQIYNRYGLPNGRDQKANDPVICVIMYHNRGIHYIGFINTYYYFNVPGRFDPREFSFWIAGNKENNIWISRGEWHSLAVTWKVDNGSLHVEIFLDGISRRVMNFPEKNDSIRDFNSDDYIGIGGMGFSQASILSYRLSNRVRTKEEITSKEPLKADDATTFFMNGAIAAKFKKYNREKYFKMLKNQKMDIEKETFFGEFKIIDTPKGKAIQFYSKLSK